MKRTVDGKRAHQLESVVLPKSDANLRRDRAVYCIDDFPGLFQRISNEDQAPEAAELVYAWYDSSVHPFLRMTSVEAELSEAGFTTGAKDDRGASQVP